MESFQKIRSQFPDKFLLLQDYEERKISENEVEVTGAESARAFDSFKDVYAAYRKLKREGKRVLYCTPHYVDSFIFERQPSARVLG